jgi:hypothetical protein
MSLASPCGTWMAHGLHPFHQCLALLTSHASLATSEQLRVTAAVDMQDVYMLYFAQMVFAEVSS